jgi:tetratricopeptide (TPR) repeat protein
MKRAIAACLGKSGTPVDARRNLLPARIPPDEAIRLRPDLAKGWLARGMVRLRQERPDLALSDLKTAVRLDPENPAGWANLQLVRRALNGP